MINIKQLKKINDWQWEIPLGTRKDMRVPAIIYASWPILESLFRDKSLDQLVNVTTLPGIQGAAILMPDAHEGYGFPIGGVAATRYPDGVISPGGIGYDINCGVRLLKTSLFYEDISSRSEDIARELYKNIPSGVGKGGPLKLNHKEMDQVLKKGALWAVENGFGEEEDLPFIESYGRIEQADPSVISSYAMERGHDQLGTIGSGNHFVEVDKVSQLFDEEGARSLGLSKNQVVILIHTGSRGLGHQVATDYIRQMMMEMGNYEIVIPDRELACLPFNSGTGNNYFRAMAGAANFAWCNREVITSAIRTVMKKIFGDRSGEVSLVYDVAHNIAKVEEHLIEGEKQKLIVHRKGATRSFGPGFSELPPAYQGIGQPVLIPGSMGTASYILVGTQKSMEASFGTTCHGAGRRLSRRAAKKAVKGREMMDELKARGIFIQAGSQSGIAEEAPEAYKDVNQVVETVHMAGIARKVAKLTPIAVVKG